MLSNALVLILGPLLAVHAQSVTDSAEPPTNTDIPACFTTCITTTPGCNGIVDLSCFCTQPGFQDAFGACIASGCSPEEQTAASALQGSCEGISQSDTASGSLTGESSATATSSGDVGETSSGESATPSATSPGSSTSGASTTSPKTSAASSIVSSTSSAATSPASTSNAAVSLTPFGLGTTHAIGAAGVAFGLVAGVVVLF